MHANSSGYRKQFDYTGYLKCGGNLVSALTIPRPVLGLRAWWSSPALSLLLFQGCVLPRPHPLTLPTASAGQSAHSLRAAAAVLLGLQSLDQLPPCASPAVGGDENSARPSRPLDEHF